MQIIRVKPLTFRIVGFFIFFWIFLFLVLIDIFNGFAEENLFRGIAVDDTHLDDTYLVDTHLDDTHLDDTHLLDDTHPLDEPLPISYVGDESSIEWRQWNSRRMVSSVIAKYLKKGKGFTLYKENLTPQDRRIIEEAEQTDYPPDFSRRGKSVDGMNESALSLPRQYAFSSSKHGREYYDYTNHYVVFTDQEKNFRVESEFGKGHYCVTYMARDLKRGKDVVLKSLKKIKIAKIKRELTVLEKVKSIPNVIQLVAPVRDKYGMPGYVFEFEPHDSGRYETMTMTEIKIFTKQLLVALDRIHSLGIMHRDVKPGNLRYDFERMRLVLIDFGLAEYYLPDAEYNVNVATKGYKAPELLLGFERYDYSADMWSVGCVIAGQVFHKGPERRASFLEAFHTAADKYEVITAIGAVLGRQDLMDYIEKYQISVLEQAMGPMARIKREKRVDFRQFIEKSMYAPGEEQMIIDAIDLMDKLMVYDHKKRLTAREALSHRFITG